MTSRRVLTAGALLTVIGLAIAAAVPIAGADDSGRASAEQALGGVIALLGWATLAWGIHKYGREA
jgi:hypothetical protein